MSGRFKTPLRSGDKGKRGLTERVRTADDRGWMSVPAGSEEFTYEVNIDWADVAQMAFKAAGNKSGISNSGALQVRITGRRRVGVS